MPADDTLPQGPSPHHSSGTAPYPCSGATRPPGGAEWAVDYGFCRSSLDALIGHKDPRCPASCPHKAPPRVVGEYGRRVRRVGVAAAAEWTRGEYARITDSGYTADSNRRKS